MHEHLSNEPNCHINAGSARGTASQMQDGVWHCRCNTPRYSGHLWNLVERAHLHTVYSVDPTTVAASGGSRPIAHLGQVPRQWLFPPLVGRACQKSDCVQTAGPLTQQSTRVGSGPLYSASQGKYTASSSTHKHSLLIQRPYASHSGRAQLHGTRQKGQRKYNLRLHMHLVKTILKSSFH